ncbi:MAG: hypothetical protein NTY77_15095 [Elusimicrobia bacterium]|nr:hypothetical protein [Elusimicrobiota bacterium]
MLRLLLLWTLWAPAAQAARFEVAPVEARAIPQVVPTVQLAAPLSQPLLAPQAQFSLTPSPLVAPAFSPVPAVLAPETVAPLGPVLAEPAPGAPAIPPPEAPAGPAVGPERSPEDARADGELFDGPVLALPPDDIPAWPGQTGDRVRIAGQTYELAEKLGEGTSAWVYRVKGRDLVVKLIAPELKDIEVFGAEAAALAAMSKTDIPHAALRAASADGLALVKDLVVGTPMHEAGRLSAEQRAGLVELMVRLVRIGHTADLNMGNLYWTKSGWVLVDAGGFAPTSPWGPIGQYLSPERSEMTGFPAAELLAAVRQRLGPDSAEWRAVLATAQYPHQKQALAALARLDAGRR